MEIPPASPVGFFYARLLVSEPGAQSTADAIGATEPGTTLGAAPTSSSPTKWLWPDVIPLSAVTILAGGAAALPLAVRIAATMDGAENWPDFGHASPGAVFWMCPRSPSIEKLRPQISAAGSNCRLHFLSPETDRFGLPIQHFAWKLAHLRSKIVGNADLVVIESFLHHIVSDAFEETLEELHRAVEQLSEFAVSTVLPPFLEAR